MPRLFTILVVAALLYFLYRRRSTIRSQGEWAEYVPGTFKVIDGGKTIAGVDDK